MKELTILADNPVRTNNYTPGQIGGAEHELDALISYLERDGYKITLLPSTTPVNQLPRNNILFSNFIRCSEIQLNQIIDEGFTYSIIENDFKCFPGRIVENPYMDNGICRSLRFTNFYKHAKNVFTVSTKQFEILKKNLPQETNLVNLGISIWSGEDMAYIAKVAYNIQPYKKLFEDVYLLHGTSIATKGLNAGINYCSGKNKIISILPNTDKKTFINNLAKGETFVFLPEITESYSRVTVEAKILHNNIITNDKVPSAQEDYVKNFAGLELIKEVSNKLELTIKLLKELI